MNGKDPGGPGRRKLATPPSRKEPSWTRLLIKMAIAIVLFNIIAGILAWHFILSRPKH